jgi:hypothetical protein
MPTLDETIAQHLRDAEASGELARHPHWGKPLPEDAAWEATPVEFRMPFKILRDAGYTPPEVALFRERAALAEELAACSDPARRADLAALRAALEQRLALRLEALRLRGTL